MKNLYKMLALGLITVSLSACSEDFLETEKIGEPTASSFYSGDVDLVEASNALYAPLWQYHYNWARNTFANLVTDDGLDRELLNFHEFTFDETHFLFSYNWRYNYRGILIANQLINNVDGEDLPGY
ncbi:hypothetical protein V6R21_29325 [Limibacter armeniacum]|uniref:hypothetical protein n=1 Tax=Limibacter armeniacum TaxID=466084 RepID=UPI002FE63309